MYACTCLVYENEIMLFDELFFFSFSYSFWTNSSLAWQFEYVHTHRREKKIDKSIYSCGKSSVSAHFFWVSSFTSTWNVFIHKCLSSIHIFSFLFEILREKLKNIFRHIAPAVYPRKIKIKWTKQVRWKEFWKLHF